MASTPPKAVRGPGPPEQTVDLLVVAPTRRELGDLPLGQRAGVQAAVTGIGEAAAPAFTELLIAHRPALVLSIGFAGGLTSQLRSGALVACDSFRANLASRAGPLPSIDADAATLRAVVDQLAEAGQSVSSGPVLTVPTPLLTSDDKRRAGPEKGAALVDMEGYWLAKAAAEHQVRFVGLRVVLDAVDQELPTFVATIIASQSSQEWRHAVRWLLAHPWGLPWLVALAYRARRARLALRHAVQVLVPALRSIA